MKLFTLLLSVCLLLSPLTGPAQDSIVQQSPKTDTATKNPGSTRISQPDDDFTAGLLLMAVIFLSALFGIVVVSSFAATLVLLFLFALIVTGILSASILTGIYRRSFAAGFRTFLMIVCGIGGVLIGIPGFWLINRVFRLHLATSSVAGLGVAVGVVGGILLAFSLYGIIRSLTAYFSRRLGVQR